MRTRVRCCDCVTRYNFALTSYATVAFVTARLLHCVQLPGSGSLVLFIQGSLDCDRSTGWQLLMLIVLVREGGLLSPHCTLRVGAAGGPTLSHTRRVDFPVTRASCLGWPL